MFLQFWIYTPHFAQNWSFNPSNKSRRKHWFKRWPTHFSCFPHRCRNTTYPLSLPQVSIVFIFVNEALSVILRSIHSAINRTPSYLLKEIILVDDNSSNSKEQICTTNQKQNPIKSVFCECKQAWQPRQTSDLLKWPRSSADVFAKILCRV